MASTANTAGLTSGPSGSTKLVGMPEPGASEQITSKMTGQSHQFTAPGSATEVKTGGGNVAPESFTRPGGVTKV